MCDEVWFDEETALGLLMTYRTTGGDACPCCGSRVNFNPSRDETRSVNWYIKCTNLRCGKFRDHIPG